MDEEKLTDIITPVAKTATVYAYKRRHLIQKYWKKALLGLKLGKPEVLVTGRAGVGKSVLIAQYHGEANRMDWQLPDTSTDVELAPISIGEWTKIVSVIPGQNTAERSQALDNALNNGLQGIIHVVDWGYTSVRDDAIKSRMIDEGIDSIAEIRKQNLSLELKEFQSLLNSIKLSVSNGRGPKWLAIAINKVDLYESELVDAKKHYHPDIKSPFSDALHSFYDEVNRNSIKVTCIPVSSIQDTFEWNDEKIESQVKCTIHQRSYIRKFLEKLVTLQQTAES